MLYELWRECVDWCAGLFGRGKAPDAEPAKKRKRKIKTRVMPKDGWTVSELLDTLDAQYSAFKLRPGRDSGLHPWQLRLLRKAGPMVFSSRHALMSFGREGANPDKVTKFLSKDIAGMSPPPFVYIGMYDEPALIPDKITEQSEKDFHPLSFFAIRLGNEKEVAVETQAPGEQYLLGQSAGFACGIENAYGSRVRIDFKTGVITPIKAVRLVPHRVKGRTVCALPSWGVENAWMYEDGRAEQNLTELAYGCFSAWRRKGELYQVATRKGGRRVTFVVVKGRQVGFFRDRDKTAIASDGKRKRIVHYVERHERVTKHGTTIVKAHLRGIRRFRWHGYQVAISIPSSHLVLDDMSIAPVEGDDSPRFIPADEAIGRVADWQDTNTYQHGEQHAAHQG